MRFSCGKIGRRDFSTAVAHGACFVGFSLYDPQSVKAQGSVPQCRDAPIISQLARSIFGTLLGKVLR
jgi:hypothetical protein